MKTVILGVWLFFFHLVGYGQLTKVWDYRYGGSGADGFQFIAPYPRGEILIETRDGGLMVAGFSNSPASGDRTEPSQGGYNYWIVKTDRDGKKQWDKRYGGSGNDLLAGVIQTSDGGYMLRTIEFSYFR